MNQKNIKSSTMPVRTHSRKMPTKILFHDKNILQTSHIPTEMREYGFMKVTSKGTPFPKRESLDTDLLLYQLRKQSLSNLNTAKWNPFESSSSFSNNELMEECTLRPSTTSKYSAFELQRKKFDEAEFTITKGKKTSENIHRIPDTFTANSQKSSKTVDHKDFEQVCRMMNFKITFATYNWEEACTTVFLQSFSTLVTSH